MTRRFGTVRKVTNIGALQASGPKTPMNCKVLGRGFTFTALEDARQRAERVADFTAQHGPVRVIMQGGKRV